MTTARTTHTQNAREAYDRAMEIIGGLCDGSLRWRMSIPAQPASDPDLVLSDSLRTIKDAMEREAAEVTRLRALNARMEEALRELRQWGFQVPFSSELDNELHAILAELDASAEKQRPLAEPGGGYYENTMRDAGRGHLLR